MTDTHDTVEPLAVVGLAVRAPGADNADEFWRNLVEGRESVTFFTEEEQRDLGVAQEDLEHPSWVAAAPLVTDARDFDAAAFGMSAREATVMDPQHRMFLEVSRSALDDAGYDPGRYAGTIGVYSGTGSSSYQWTNLRADPVVWQQFSGGISVSTANSADYVSTQVSYRMNLRGPAMTVVTACSSSLVAIHLAAEAVRNGECDMAIAGGVSVEMPFGHGYISSEGFTSPDGHCRPFDAAAQGTLWGSGCGVVLIKPLSAALADGDRVRAVIRGNAINNDGADKVGFSAPSVDGQVGALTAALQVCDVDPTSVGYVEAHGTGTALGDPIEVQALSQVYGAGTDRRQWCAIGSVKSNIGHLSQAAGVVGMIKAVLSVESGLIPPSINYSDPNPAIDFSATPFEVADRLRRYPELGGPRRAAVSSFGIGGTNAHVIIEQPPQGEPASGSDGPNLLQVSAHTPTALDAALARLSRHLGSTRDELDDIAGTLSRGRPALPHRAAVAVADIDDALDAFADPRRVRRGEAGVEPVRTALMFSGQGAQYPGMAADLYRTEPVFAAALEECLGVADPALRELLLSPTSPAAEAALAQTANTQPALFALEYALGRLWESSGLTPQALVGHSIGEFVAVTLAGVLDAQDGMRLVAERGRLMQALPGGVMLSVMADLEDVTGVLDRTGHVVDVAAVNGPGAVVLSGGLDAVDHVRRELERSGVPHRSLKVSHAFHSRMMDPLLEDFRELVAGVALSAPRIPVLSNVTGTWLTAAEAVDPQYWVRHLRGTVRFGDDLVTLLGEGRWALVECGPGSQLTSLAALTGGAELILPSLPGPRDASPGDLFFLDTVGALWCAGLPVGARCGQRRVGLPGYPFERSRHWVDQPSAPTVAAPTTGVPAPIAAGVDRTPRQPQDWFATAVWQELPRLTSIEPRPVWVVGEERARPVVTALTAAGAQAELVQSLPQPLPNGIVVDTRPADAGGDWAAAMLPTLESVQRLSDESSAELVILTSGAFEVLGEPRHPEQAVVLGLQRVAPQEAPELRVRVIDADSADADLAAEILGGQDGLVRLQAGRRWHTATADLRLEQEITRAPEAVLVTGGLGGIGLVLAEDLARLGAGTVVLTGRRGLPPEQEWDALIAADPTGRTARAVAAVTRMRLIGADVRVVACDVTDPESVQALRDMLPDRGLGIVHAAGLPGGGMVAVKEADAVRAVIDPKVVGAGLLHRTFADASLDWVVLCSSVTGTVGGIGQVDYCGANAALDAAAEQRWGTTGVRPVSVGWGGWSQVGMAAEAGPDSPASSVAESAVDHPVLTRKDKHSLFGPVSTGAHWVLDEHRVEGVPVLPGTAHLEHLVRTAQELLPGSGPIEVDGLVFRSPFAVRPQEYVTCRVVLDQDGSALVTSERLDGVEVHASATLRRGESAPPSPVNLDEVRARLRPIEPCDADGNRASLVTFGPHWDCLGQVHSDPGRLDLAEITLPALGDEHPQSWGLNPAALDVATSFGFGHAQGPFLPLGYGRVTVHAPLPQRFFALLRYHPGEQGSVSADVTLVAPDGSVLLEAEEYTLRAVDSGVMAADEAGEPDATPSETGPRATTISPVEGARALRRILAGDVHGSVLVTPRSVAALRSPQVGESSADSESVGDGATQAPGTDVPAAPPVVEGDDLETSIAGIWERVLGVAEVGTDDDFFALGGNSLVAVQLVSEIRRVTRVKLPMKALFEMPTVAQVAQGVRDLRDAKPVAAVPRMERN